MKLALLLPLIATVVVAGCRPPECQPNTTRCTNNHAELCDADGYYYELMDCDQVSRQSGAPFACSYVDEETEDGQVVGHTCIPADEVADAGGDQ